MRQQKPASEAPMRSWQNTTEPHHKPPRQNPSIEEQPHQPTRNGGDATSNRKHKTHPIRTKKEVPLPNLLLSHTRETADHISLLFSLDFKNIKPIACKKMKNYQDIKKIRKKNVFPVSCFLLHHPKSETAA